MSRRRVVQAVRTTKTPALFSAGAPLFNWHDLVGSGADLAQVAAHLRRAARWSCVGTDDAGNVPELTGDHRRDIDAIDGWLTLADAHVDLDAWSGRRRWAWAQVLGQ